MSRNNKERLLQRLDDIGRSVAGAGNGLALIGLGSVGTELDRLDAYSDLDFFVIVKPGCQQAYLDDLSWLASIGPIAYGDTVVVVLSQDGTAYVPVGPICDHLGVALNAQCERIKRDPVLSEVLISVRVTRTDIDPASRQPHTSQLAALPLDFVNGFLFGINASRVKEEVRENLIRYQRECYRVLADAFLGSGTVTPVDIDVQALLQLHNMALVIAATTTEMIETKHLALDNKRRLDLAREYLQRMNVRLGGMDERVRLVEQQIRSGSLTEEQAREIQHRDNLIAREMAKHAPAEKHHVGVYETLRHQTGATSYKAIPPKGFEAAVAFLDQWLDSLSKA
jgi:hypothetical protein